MAHKPGCWHCEHKDAWRALVALDMLLIVALFVGPLRVIEMLAWIVLVSIVAGANLDALLQRVTG